MREIKLKDLKKKSPTELPENPSDKDLAGITVKEIPNVFDVKNELQVVK